MKAPSWPQMTLNVFWLEELEVRGKMLEYEDARGGNVFSFDLQCCWFTHDHGECIPFYKAEVNMDETDAWNDMFET